jgi:hypothetical protein
MEEDNENVIDVKSSKLNSGMLQIFRLDFLWKERHTHARRGDYSKWNEDLDSIWCELAGDVQEGDSNEKKYNQLDLEYSKSLITTKQKKGFEKSSSEEVISRIRQKKALMKKELFLRRLQNTQGKGTAYNDDEDILE